MVRLEGKAPSFRAGDMLDLTEYSGLDGASKPGWFVPGARVSAPTPAPTASPAKSGG